MTLNDFNFVELTDDKHLDFIATTSNLTNERQIQLKNDFKKGYFYGLLTIDQKNKNEIHGYTIYYYSYSTWEARVMYLSKVWLQDNNESDLCFTQMFEKLIEIAGKMQCCRINYNLDVVKEPRLCNLFLKFGPDLTESEKWNFFRIDHDRLRMFADVDKNKFFVEHKSKRISIKRVNLNSDAEHICSLIRELAVYEKLEEQFNLKPTDLIRDYGENSFYDCFVARVDDTNEMIAYAIFYYGYLMNIGRTCYLEDLYVKPEWRHIGLGTLMWRKVAFEALEKDAVVMEWNCLEWNTPAIDFYHKHNGYNTTSKENLHLFRILKERIYLQQDNTDK